MDSSKAAAAKQRETQTGQTGGAGAGEPNVPDGDAPFRFVHTTNFPELLQSVGGSLLVTTYQAGKLVAFRAVDGRLSMLLRTFDKAMGLAVQPHRLAIGTTYQVWTLYNSPDVAAKMKPRGQYDACFLPRSSHVTGNIDVHELAWGHSSSQDGAPQDAASDLVGDELWIVNTLFSCLCTLEPDYSFVPRWMPPFVTELKRQDRCHLNGVAMINGRPGFVTAFGETNTPEGWRPGKVEGGVVIDVASGETVARGFSMPHSPRVHAGRLWVLDSGQGRLTVVDPRSGQVDTVATLPGYTRGLAFVGHLAFVGLSKIRETAVFGGVPIAAEGTERKCGVAVVDLRSGNLVALLDFQQSAEELFDLQLLPSARFPAIVGFQKETIQQACVIGRQRPIQPSPSDDGLALVEEGRLHDARDHLEQALADDPHDVNALFVLATQVYPPLGDWCKGLPALRQLVERCPENVHFHDSLLMSLHYGEQVSLPEIAAEHQRWNERHGKKWLAARRPIERQMSPDARLRVGFLSADFRHHAVAYFLLPLLLQRPADQWAAVCYSNGSAESQDQYTDEFRRTADRFLDVRPLTDEQLAETIRADEIDILIDLNGHTAGNRLEVLARQPAPVQASWLDYVGSTGLETIDYFITDRIHTRPGEEQYYSERVWYLPQDYICYQPPAYAPDVGPLPALQKGYVTFGNFNVLSKLTPQIFELWAQLLQRMPSSRLRLNATVLRCPRARAEIHERFTERGVAASRIALLSGGPHQAFLDAYNQVDLGLDSFPYSGGLTTCESLWMGVPVITRGGDRVCSRHASSHLTHAGLPEFITSSPDEYLERALQWAGDLDRLAECRAGLREKVSRSPLMDSAQFARDFTSALRSMWQRACATAEATAAGTAGTGRAGSISGSTSSADELPATQPSLDAQRHYQDGLAFLRDKRLNEALASFQSAAQLQPGDARAHNSIGNVLLGLDRKEDAVVAYRNATRANPQYTKAWNNLALVLNDLQRFGQAEKAGRRALEIDPEYALAHNNLGNTLRCLERLDEAVDCFAEAVKLKPDYTRARCNWAATLAAAKRWEEAEEVFRRILADEPELIEARCGLGNVLMDRERLEEAALEFERALELDPTAPAAWNDLGLTRQHLAQFDAAIANYERALELAPDHDVVHRNFAYALLQQGMLKEAWPHFEWRWKGKSPTDPPLDSPPWDGSPLAGRTIVLFTEQGLGDTIQFLRFAPLLSSASGPDEKSAGRVVLACQPALVPLAQTCDGLSEVVPKNGPAPKGDCHAPLMSLPAVLGTTLETLPAQVPYLAAREERILRWQQELQEFPGFRVGITWQGNPEYRGDAQRSIPLAQFAPLASVPEVQLFSLQKGFGCQQLEEVDFPVINLGPRLDEDCGAFEDTAAVMTQLDLLISSDTSTVHLAGALGIPVWVALHHVPDWRFLLDRTDSPWYPTMRLFRQPRRGDWDEVFRRLAAALQETVRVARPAPNDAPRGGC